MAHSNGWITAVACPAPGKNKLKPSRETVCVFIFSFNFFPFATPYTLDFPSGQFFSASCIQKFFRIYATVCAFILLVTHTRHCVVPPNVIFSTTCSVHTARRALNFFFDDWCITNVIKRCFVVEALGSFPLYIAGGIKKSRALDIVRNKQLPYILSGYVECFTSTTEGDVLLWGDMSRLGRFDWFGNGFSNFFDCICILFRIFNGHFFWFFRLFFLFFFNSFFYCFNFFFSSFVCWFLFQLFD